MYCKNRTDVVYLNCTTFIFETGQGWKTAALRIPKCVCFFVYGDKMEKYMDIALKEAKKAYKKCEVPVGAVIVKNNKILAIAHNKKENSKNVTRHAEIIAIEKACKKLKTWHLDDCEIFVTLEPCLMCCGAIEQARIKKITYSAPSPLFGQIENNHQVFKDNKKIIINKENNQKEALELLQSFFKLKRK